MGHVTHSEDVRLSELVTTLDWADTLGCKAATVTAYRARHRLPKPVGFVNSTPVWTKAQLAAYVASRRGQGFRSDIKGESSEQ